MPIQYALNLNWIKKGETKSARYTHLQANKYPL